MPTSKENAEASSVKTVAVQDVVTGNTVFRRVDVNSDAFDQDNPITITGCSVAGISFLERYEDAEWVQVAILSFPGNNDVFAYRHEDNKDEIDQGLDVSPAEFSKEVGLWYHNAELIVDKSQSEVDNENGTVATEGIITEVVPGHNYMLTRDDLEDELTMSMYHKIKRRVADARA